MTEKISIMSGSNLGRRNWKSGRDGASRKEGKGFSWEAPKAYLGSGRGIQGEPRADVKEEIPPPPTRGIASAQVHAD